jgi:hypothetical protein
MVNAARSAGIPLSVIGKTGGQALTIGSEPPISLEELQTIHESWLPQYMGSS